MDQDNLSEEKFQPGDLIHQRYQLQQKLGQAFSRQTWLAQELNCPENSSSFC